MAAASAFLEALAILLLKGLLAWGFIQLLPFKDPWQKRAAEFLLLAILIFAVLRDVSASPMLQADLPYPTNPSSPSNPSRVR